MKEKVKRIFISHAQDDFNSTKIKDLLKSILNKYGIFFSVDPEAGIETGKSLHEEINRELKECSIFMAVVTENYVRSAYCLYEMSVARYLQKSNFIIYTNENIKKRINTIVDPEWISVILGDKGPGDDDIKKMQKLSGDIGNEQLIKEFLTEIAEKTSSNRTFVGMSDEMYNNLIDYCQQEGITKFTNGSVYSAKEKIEKFSHAKKVYIVTTTGAALFKELREKAMVDALRNEAEIKIILPDRDSQFCQDVAEAESDRPEFNLVIAQQNRFRIESEFVASIQYLNEAYCLAKENYTGDIGSITCYNSRTLLRETIVLLLLDDGSYWGWVNMTIPPLRTSETPCFAIDTYKNDGLCKKIVKHCECLTRVAKKGIRKINGKTPADKMETSSHEEYWHNKKALSEEFMKKRRGLSKVLIEVAAQHPLVEGEYPNPEFQNRLDKALQLSEEIGREKVWFYSPGSLHKFNNKVDKIALSTAGKNYLTAHGIDKNHIYAENANVKYKGEDGVYNSADESYVASCIFKDDDFGRMICICSPFQIMRKTFYYMEFGLIAECYGVTAKDMFHNPISEYFGSLHYTVNIDHSWQDDNSEAAEKSRKDRKPQS